MSCQVQLNSFPVILSFYLMHFNQGHQYASELSIIINPLIIKQMLNSFLRLRHTFLQSKYHKLKITRLPQEEFAVMIKDDTTLSQLTRIIQDEFHQTTSELLVGTAFTSNLALLPVNEQIREANNKYKDQPFLPIMLNNDLFIYEVIKDRAHLIYGLECLQLNYTNNRNLPEKIQQGIIDLIQDWNNVKTVNQALTTPPLINSKDPEIIQERQQFQKVLSKTVALNRLINQVKMDNSLFEFVKKVSLVMGANWIFLFAVTFGLYGWDTGEPIAYLTSAGIDLLALLRYFDLQQKMNYEKAVNEGKWMGLLNLAAHKRQQRWLHCHMRRLYY